MHYPQSFHSNYGLSVVGIWRLNSLLLYREDSRSTKFVINKGYCALRHTSLPSRTGTINVLFILQQNKLLFFFPIRNSCHLTHSKSLFIFSLEQEAFIFFSHFDYFSLMVYPVPQSKIRNLKKVSFQLTLQQNFISS